MTSVPHILEKIFFSLDYASHKASREVCKRWYELLATEAYQNNLEKVQDKEVDLFMYSWKGDHVKVQELLSSGTEPNCIQSYALNKRIKQEKRTRNIPPSMAFTGMKQAFQRNTPLSMAVTGAFYANSYDKLNRYMEAVKLLLNAGADPNKGNLYGKTPLHLLLEAGASPNITYNAGPSPHYVFASVGCLQLLQIHLDAGADPNLSDREGITPLHLATEIGSSLSGTLGLINALLRAGANPNLAKKGGVTPLLQSAWKREENVVEVLLNAGADPNKADCHGNTSLSFAAEKGLLKTVKVLLDHGADPNVADEHGTTPLQHALKYVNYSYGSGAHKAVAKLLIERGAKHDEEDNSNMVTSTYPCSIL